MNEFQAFLSGLLYGANRLLFILVVAHFGQGAFMAYKAHTTGNLSLLGVTAFCSVVVLVCAWRIYRVIKQSREIRAIVEEY